MTEDATFSGPWYRDRWPWLIMSVPAISAILGIAMLVLAMSSYDGLVAEDYYKEGLAINAVLDKEAQAKRLGLSAEIRVVDGAVNVVLQGAPAEPAALKLRLAHPTRAGEDLALRLSRTGAHTYTAAWPTLSEGRWHAMLEDEAGTWRMAAAWQSGTARHEFGAKEPQ